MERNDVLRLPVFEDRESAAVEGGDDVLLVVDHGGVQQNFVHIFAEDEDSLVVDVFVLAVFLVGVSLLGLSSGLSGDCGEPVGATADVEELGELGLGSF